jgi:hypothetical protein
MNDFCQKLFKLTALLLITALTACAKPILEFDDPFGVPGMYVGEWPTIRGWVTCCQETLQFQELLRI